MLLPSRDRDFPERSLTMKFTRTVNPETGCNPLAAARAAVSRP
jgi:hypothetical protein